MGEEGADDKGLEESGDSILTTCPPIFRDISSRRYCVAIAMAGILD